MDRIGLADRTRPSSSESRHERLLARFGVSAAAETVWRILLREPLIPVRNLLDETGLAESDVDASISELLAAELVRGASSPTGVGAIDPGLSVGRYVAKAERELAEHAETLSRVRAALPDLARQRATGPLDAGDLGLEIVPNLVDVQAQTWLAAERVRHDLRCLDHEPGVITTENVRAIQADVLRRGVRDRTIVAPVALATANRFEYFDWLQEQGHEVRALPDIDTRLFIYDNELAILPVDPNDPQRGAFFIRVKIIIDALILMYDYMWSSATPIFTTAGSDCRPTGRRARVLELLNLGAKDATIARTLGVGVRTIRREVAGLKATLGVTSRAEIVAGAIRRGWL